MDGVLIDSEPTHEKAIIALSRELGDELTDHPTIQSFKGAPEKFMARRLMEIYPEQARTSPELIARKVELYAALFAEHVTLIPQAIDFLKASRTAGRLHGLTTSASRSTQRLSFETFGFGPYFDIIITGEDITKGKPDPEPFILTAEKLGLDPAGCIVIEDSINGVRSGHAAGCTVIALTTTFPREALFEAGADHVIDSYSELLEA
ncbi:MAG: HAD family phosphatase [Verrucomicrobiaceae bacterium]|nr:MAG: HAD family phosphatase [Verrucomicrobiaceae bacterium]